MEKVIYTIMFKNVNPDWLPDYDDLDNLMKNNGIIDTSCDYTILDEEELFNSLLSNEKFVERFNNKLREKKLEGTTK